MSKTERYVGYGLWALVFLSTVIAFSISGWQITSETLTSAIVVTLLLIAMIVIVAVGLVIVYRRLLSHWALWLIIIGLCVLGALSVQGSLRPPVAWLSLLITLLFPASGAALLTATTITLIRYDVGLLLLALVTIIGIWGLAIVVRAQDNLIETMFRYLQTGRPAIVWWLNLFFCTSVCLIPLAALSFLWHTIKLLGRELNVGRRTTAPRVSSTTSPTE